MNVRLLLIININALCWLTILSYSYFNNNIIDWDNSQSVHLSVVHVCLKISIGVLVNSYLFYDAENEKCFKLARNF